MEPGTVLTISRRGGQFAATLKTPTDGVIRFVPAEYAGDALDVFGVAPEARSRIDTLFTFARVDELTLTRGSGWAAELTYWRDGELRVHRVGALTSPDAVDACIAFLLWQERKGD